MQEALFCQALVLLCHKYGIMNPLNFFCEGL